MYGSIYRNYDEFMRDSQLAYNLDQMAIRQARHVKGELVPVWKFHKRDNLSQTQ